MVGGFLVDGGGDDDSKQYPGKLTAYVVITCIIVAMGGLTFGYDIGISGGVTSMPQFLQKNFPSVYRKELDSSTNQYCKFDDTNFTLFTYFLYLAAFVTSFFVSWIPKKCGRKISMLLRGLVFLAGAATYVSSQNHAMLIIGRLFLGYDIGFLIQYVPVYVSEMAPNKHQGRLNIVFQLSIIIGILTANIVNYFTAMIDSNLGWRVGLGYAAVLALFVFVFVSALFVPNTTNSMLEKGQPDEACYMLRRIRGVSEEEVEAEFRDLVAASEAAKVLEHPWRKWRERRHHPQLIMSIFISLFQQIIGINVIMFYAPVLFKTLGFGGSASLLSSVITGLVNAFATSVSRKDVDNMICV